MKLSAMFVLIGFLIVFGATECIFGRFLLGTLSNSVVVLLIGAINFLVVLLIIRLNTKPSIHAPEGATLP